MNIILLLQIVITVLLDLFFNRINNPLDIQLKYY